jgi:uncharacterized integral membrane protein
VNDDLLNDDLLQPEHTPKAAKWVIVIVGAMLLLVLALPFIAIFTNLF